MAPTVPTKEPFEITAGDLVTWKKTLSDYPATSYELSYSLQNASASITITAAASGDDHLVSELPATTAAWTAGTYDYQAYATDTPSARYKIGEGTIKILPDFAAQSSGYDNRTHAKKMIDAIESLIEGKTGDVSSYSIGGRSITKLSPAELGEWLTFYRAEYARQRMAERRKRGSKTGRLVKVSFE